jgi:hypothetical protein
MSRVIATEDGLLPAAMTGLSRSSSWRVAGRINPPVGSVERRYLLRHVAPTEPPYITTASSVARTSSNEVSRSNLLFSYRCLVSRYVRIVFSLVSFYNTKYTIVMGILKSRHLYEGFLLLRKCIVVH